MLVCQKRFLLVVLSAAVLLLPIGLLAVRLRGGRILGRVYLDGLAIGGLTPAQTERILRQHLNRCLSRPIPLIHGRHTWTLRPRTIGIAIDWQNAVARALAVGRRGWIGARLAEAAKAYLRPRRLRLQVRITRSSLVAALIAQVAPAVEHPAGNAFYAAPGGTIVPARAGWRIDLARTAANLNRAVLARSRRYARLVLRRIPPATTTQDLASLHLRYVLSSYMTSLAGSPLDRLANIRLGTAQLNGTLLRPGAVFSFNGTTGPRDAVHGYHRAPEILRREIVPGFGGGICQVATTLYNAVLLAGLPVKERSCHSLPPGYVPLGRDATVYYPGLDFRFANVTPGHLMILATVRGDSLHLRLLGEHPRPHPVWIISQVLDTLAPPLVEADDPRATQNKEGAPGYRVRVTRLYGDPERPARVEAVSEDVYQPVPRVRVPGGAAPAAD